MAVSFTRTECGVTIEIVVLEGEKVLPSGVELFFGVPLPQAKKLFYVSDDRIDLETLMDYWIERLYEFNNIV